MQGAKHSRIRQMLRRYREHLQRRSAPASRGTRVYSFNGSVAYPADDRLAMNESYATAEPTPSEIGMLDGPVVLEFGSRWCGYCRAAQPLLAAALEMHARVRHIKIADGSGRPLGRYFAVKLWPTLVFLNNGDEVARLVRPRDVGVIRDALAQIDSDR